MRRTVRRAAFHDSSSLKGRIAEALVEAIFRRAGYTVSRVGRESQVNRLIKVGADEFLPDFLVRKRVPRDDGARPLHRLLPVEVKYRRDITSFLRRFGTELFDKVTTQWPDLCVVFVTDDPDEGRSCFQAIDFWQGEGKAPSDLHGIRDLEIYETTVREYEQLVRQIFPLLEQRTTRADVLRRAAE